MKRWQDWVQIANLLMLVVFAWLLLGGMPHLLRWRAARLAPEPPKRPVAFDWVDPSKGLKIISFYGTPGILDEGETASICFGVQNAKSVRIDPPISELKPTFNRCLEAAPVKDTRYTLTAEDGTGQVVTESFELKVRPDPMRGPKIEYFNVRSTSATRDGTVHLICFATWNADLVAIQPPAFPAWKLLQGCFSAIPKEKTEYTLTAHGTMGRKASKRLTIAP